MIRRLIRIAILIPTLTLLWGYANALGATQAVNNAMGTNIGTSFKIPFVDQQWAMGNKEIPRPEIIARETMREAGRQNLVGRGLAEAKKQAIKAGLTAKELKAEYDKGLTEAQKAQYGDPAAAPAPAAKTTAPKTAAAGGKTKAQVDAAKAYKNAKALPVKGRAPKTGYSRDQFGTAWTDTAGGKYKGNGCDTRNDILARDLVNETFKPNTGNCKVLTGTLPYEPYLGTKDRKFVASGTFAESLDAEHIVALGDAWQKGAQNISKAQRTALANDPANLMMTDPGQNRAKGDADAASWLPKNKSYRCTYIIKQVNVKGKYKLWVTQAEQDMMLKVLKPCL